MREIQRPFTGAFFFANFDQGKAAAGDRSSSNPPVAIQMPLPGMGNDGF